MSQTFRQELPPSQGYKPINVTRIPQKEYFKGRTMILAYAGITVGAFYLYTFSNRKVKRERTENLSAEVAMSPILHAETDRIVLKQLIKNKKYEEEIMKDVENWEFGKLYNQPIYKTVPEDSWTGIHLREYYGHYEPKEYYKRRTFTQWS